MFKSKKFMQRVSMMVIMALSILLLTGCGGKASVIKDLADKAGMASLSGDDSSEEKESSSNLSAAKAATAGESFSAYLNAKSELMTTLSNALISNPGTELISMNLLGITLVDLALIPATCFGLGQEATMMALAFMGASDVDYSEDGNSYSIKYRNNEGKLFEMRGNYDKAADSLTCTVLEDGKESLISEYRKTSFGYVSQMYSVDNDGSAYVYKMAISDKEGAVGISDASAAPKALSGSEGMDFPKQCSEWYAIKEDKFTGLTSEGNELSFVYTPPEDEE